MGSGVREMGREKQNVPRAVQVCKITDLIGILLKSTPLHSHASVSSGTPTA
jgi:hypothetical protein